MTTVPADSTTLVESLDQGLGIDTRLDELEVHVGLKPSNGAAGEAHS
jgi:hypothetical protein